MARPTNVGVRRLLIDSNVVDRLADDADLRAVVLDAIAEGRIQLVMTHIQADELAAVPDDARRTELLAALEIVEPADVATAGFVIGVSRLDRATLFGDDTAKRHSSFVNTVSDQRHKRTNDALLLATAEREAIPFVTTERRLGRIRQHFPTVQLLTIEDLLALAVGVGS